MHKESARAQKIFFNLSTQKKEIEKIKANNC